MATDGKTPQPCDDEIFKNGKPIVAIEGRSNAVEEWVKKVAFKADARIDWHYSGGIAQVIHLGNSESRVRVMSTIRELELSLSGRIIRYFEETDEGLYRKDVTPIPEGAIAGFYNGGSSSSFIVQDEKDR